jgi:hypothetical protein
MVTFGFEDWTNISMSGVKPPIHLVIYTNEITKEILECVNTEKTPNIIFEIPKLSGYRVFDLLAEIHHWEYFARNIQSLAFHGVLVENQFTVQHFECMPLLKHLTIGATTYPLFEGEDISKLPLIRRFIGSGYGIVKTSESLNKWIRKIRLNAEASGFTVNDYYVT